MFFPRPKIYELIGAGVAGTGVIAGAILSDPAGVAELPTAFFAVISFAAGGALSVIIFVSAPISAPPKFCCVNFFGKKSVIWSRRPWNLCAWRPSGCSPVGNLLKKRSKVVARASQDRPDGRLSYPKSPQWSLMHSTLKINLGIFFPFPLNGSNIVRPPNGWSLSWILAGLFTDLSGRPNFKPIPFLRLRDIIVRKQLDSEKTTGQETEV